MEANDAEILIYGWQRPPHDQVQAFAGVPSSIAANLGEAPSALDYRIRRISGNGVVVGSALTASAPAGDNLAVFAALAQAEAGDILVLATGFHQGCAAIGDRVATMAAGAGIRAIITDGLARDVVGIREIGLSVHACGLSPISPRQAGPARVGCRIEIGDICVRSGDLIIADEDGVAVIAAGAIGTALQRLPEALRADSEAVAAAREGARYPARLEPLLKRARHLPTID